MNYLAKNLKFLRLQRKESQSHIGSLVDKRSTAVSSWELDQSQPSLKDIETIANYFGKTSQELLFVDLCSVQVSDLNGNDEMGQNVQQNVQQTVQIKGQNEHLAAQNEQPEDHRISGLEWREQNEALRMAIAALSASNQRLLQDIEELKEENRLLKKGSTPFSGGMESPAQRAAG